MLYRILALSLEHEFHVLCPNGDVYVNRVLFEPKTISNLTVCDLAMRLLSESMFCQNNISGLKWNEKYIDMTEYHPEANCIAYVSDAGQLVINDIRKYIDKQYDVLNRIVDTELYGSVPQLEEKKPFQFINDFNFQIEKFESVRQNAYLSVNEYAELHKKSVEQIKKYCREGRIESKKIDGRWFINPNAPLPKRKMRVENKEES